MGHFFCQKRYFGTAFENLCTALYCPVVGGEAPCRSKTLNHHHHHHHHHHKKHKHKQVVVINETNIYDKPRFVHRGLLIDTARHFLPKKIIKAQLDAMAMAKLNVLHWHIIDDQSFPYNAKGISKLSEMGAFSKSAVYTSKDVQDIVSYGKFKS